MSASSKKKLRAAEVAEKLTERQLAEQKEAKTVKLYTIAFVVAMVAILVIALTVGVSKAIVSSGIRERNTVALTVGEETISSEEMSYFFVDYVQNYASQNSYMLAAMMDVYSPLNQQINPQTGETWADSLLTAAQNSARDVYALSAAAKANGHTLTEEEQLSLDTTIANLEFYAQIYGYPSTRSYLQAMYGLGSTVEGYTAYCERSMLASSYRQYYTSTRTYTDEELRQAEEGKFDNYSTFSYNSYYLSVDKFLQGGTQNEDGTTVYSDEENAAAAEAALETAKALTDTEMITTLEQLDLAISGLDINKGSETPVNSSRFNQLYTAIGSDVATWLADDRKEGDLGYVARLSTSDGESKVIGYYILYFIGRDDNLDPLPNVRHILLGSQAVLNGETTYTEEELATYKADAEELLAQWQAGDATEESFAALAEIHSLDTGSVSNGGLYENIIPSQMVAPFDDWCFDESRQVGDFGIVETDYGYHIMYFSGYSDKNYRDLMITDELMTAAVSAWYTELVEAAVVVPGDTKYLPLDMVLQAS